MAKTRASTSPETQNVEDEDLVAEEALAQTRFPSGTKALFKKNKTGQLVPMQDEEMVFLLNVSLQRVSIRMKNDAIMTSKKHGYQEKLETVLPGGAIKVRVYDARRALAALERRGGDLKLVVAPPKGDCENEMTFTYPPADPETGEVPQGARKFKTCPFSNCPHHPQQVGANGVMQQWSIFQSQHRVAKLGTPPALRRWMEVFDPRNAVVSWALFTIQRREDSRRERMMLGTSRSQSTAVY